MLEQRLVNDEYHKWMTKLLGFDFDIQYRPGLENKAVDALSRVAQDPSLFTLTMPTLLDISTITQQVEVDLYLC